MIEHALRGFGRDAKENPGSFGWPGFFYFAPPTAIRRRSQFWPRLHAKKGRASPNKPQRRCCNNGAAGPCAGPRPLISRGVRVALASPPCSSGSISGAQRARTPHAKTHARRQRLSDIRWANRQPGNRRIWRSSGSRHSFSS